MGFTGNKGGFFEASGSSAGRSRSYHENIHYHRHTVEQIQRLESSFDESPHPDQNTRIQLGGELGLSPRQIKFWFQNKRTQLKAQQQTADNIALRQENAKIQCENIAIQEALKSIVCPSCRVPAPYEQDIYFKEQQLREENDSLKGKIKKVENLTAQYMGRPTSALHFPSLDLGHNMINVPYLDFDFLTGSSSTFKTMSFQQIRITEMQKSLMIDASKNAMKELIKLLPNYSPFWIWSPADGREVLNLEAYESVFSRAARGPSVRIESSRDSDVVKMYSCLGLIEMFMDANKLMELLPNIVSKAKTVEVISYGLMGGWNGHLQLIYEELQVMSPLIPTRDFFFLRLCQKIEDYSWAIVDVSYDMSQLGYSNSQHLARRLPSGLLIQDMLNGHSKVTWVEHVEVEDITPIHSLYKEHIRSGLAFGTTRRLATLKRTCERLACLIEDDANIIFDLGGLITSNHGRRNLMKLSQKMVNDFCSRMNPVNGHEVTINQMPDFELRASLQKYNDPGRPNSMVLSATTTILLPVFPQKVFDFFRDERSRPLAIDTSKTNMLVLQESCIDSSGALVVYSPIELANINKAMSCEDPSSIPILSLGFAISPHASEKSGAGEISAGSLLSIIVQIIVSCPTSGKMSLVPVHTVQSLLRNTIHKIKAALK